MVAEVEVKVVPEDEDPVPHVDEGQAEVLQRPGEVVAADVVLELGPQGKGQATGRGQIHFGGGSRSVSGHGQSFAPLFVVRLDS